MVALAKIFITPRLDVPAGSYQAFSDMLIGFLLLVPVYDRNQEVGQSILCGILGLLLSFWELSWLLVQKFS